MRNRRSDDSLLWPGVGAFVIGFLLSLGLARACQAQETLPPITTTAKAIWPDPLFPDTASLRTLRRMNDSLATVERSLERRLAVLRGETQRPDGTSVVLLSAGIGSIVGMIDRDAGGYRDSLFPASDKQAHAFGSVIAARALSDKFGARWGWLACVALGAGIEAGQSRAGGYASWKYDFPYNVGGCTAGALWSRGAK